jgi:hypothetical protein
MLSVEYRAVGGALVGRDGLGCGYIRGDGGPFHAPWQG